MKKILASLGMAALGLSISPSASADIIGFGASDVDGRAAEVYFDVTGGTLTITLTNTGLEDVLVPVDVLTAVYFDLAGDPDLTPVSAILADGSFIIYDTDTDDVGTEWAHTDATGVSSTGVGLFGPGDRFDTGGNLAGPTSPNGLQYGIVTASDDSGTGNGGVTGSGGLINNSVIFTLTGLPEGFTIEDISGVVFQYGTALDEPQLTGDCITCEECPDCPDPEDPVAEPATLALFGLGLAGFVKRAAGKR